MNSQSIADYSYFLNSFNSDPRPMYPTYNTSYEQQPYYEDYKTHDYTFLPKQTGFFEDHRYAPLDVTRQSTEFTDVSESAPYTQKGVLPLFRQSSQEQSLNRPPMNPKNMDASAKNKFIAVLGANTGFSFNSLQNKERQVEENNLVCQKNESVRTSESDINDEESLHEQSEDSQQPRSSTRSQNWSEEQDEILLKFASQYKCDWKRIVKKFNDSKITTQFLKSKYKELINAPLQRRIKFTHKEDLMIAKYFDKYGSNWAQMANHFSDRTAVMLKNRYYSHIRKRDLLNTLTAEVREIENDDQEIDNIKDYELNSDKEVQKSEEAIFYDGTSYSGSCQNTMHSSNGFEERHEESASYDDANSSEIQRLREKIRSLQSLYLKTKTELTRIKAQNSQ